MPCHRRQCPPLLPFALGCPVHWIQTRVCMGACVCIYECVRGACVCMSIYMCVHVCECMSTCALHAYKHACGCMHIHVCVHTVLWLVSYHTAKEVDYALTGEVFLKDTPGRVGGILSNHTEVTSLTQNYRSHSHFNNTVWFYREK